MTDYVSVGVMPARRAWRQSRTRLCPLCGNALSYWPPHSGCPPVGSEITGIRVCVMTDCKLRQNIVTGECVLPVENIPRAVARRLLGGSGPQVAEAAPAGMTQVGATRGNEVVWDAPDGSENLKYTPDWKLASDA